MINQSGLRETCGNKKNKQKSPLNSVGERFIAIAETTADAVFICDGEGKVVFWNESASKIIGYSAQEMLGNSFMLIVLERDKPGVRDVMARLSEKGPDMLTGKIKEGYILRKDGTELPVEASNCFWRKGTEVYFGGVIRDISHRRKLELERKRILEFSDNLIIVCGVDGYVKYVNPALAKILGYTKREILRWPVIKFIHPDDRSTVEDIFETLQNGKTIKDYSHRLCKKDGRVLTVIWKVTPVIDEGLFYCIGRDITDKIMAEEYLRESEERFRTFVESSIDAICTTDHEGKIIFWNSAAERILGYSCKEVLGRQADMLVPEHIKKRHTKEGKIFRNDDLPASGCNSFETIMKKKDGSEISVEITISYYKVFGRRHFSLIIRDISERKIFEEQLKTQAQNLEETNAALRLLLRRRDEDKAELEQKMLSNIKNLLVPYVDKLRIGRLDDRQRALIGIIETNLGEILAPFSQRLISKFYNLTPTEIQVAGLVRDGKNSKEIAEIMNSSARAVDSHRTSIRRKLSLKNKQANLRSYLLNNF